MINGGSLKIYASMMRSLDNGIGRVLQALRETGLERNTLVIFTSDNGGERFSYNWPFSSQKFDLREGGIRVPAIVRWPGVARINQTTEQVATTMDWTATILAASRTNPDPSYPLDGIDMLPFCRGDRSTVDRTLFWRTRRQGAARMRNWKYITEVDKEYLFDLAVDPGEKVDLRTKQSAVFADLKNRFRIWNEQILAYPPRD
jgi:arylsulfatase A-like enzyme